MEIPADTQLERDRSGVIGSKANNWKFNILTVYDFKEASWRFCQVDRAALMVR